MPSREYRILIKGIVVNREYTLRSHETMLDVFSEHGLPYTTQIVDLV